MWLNYTYFRGFSKFSKLLEIGFETVGYRRSCFRIIITQVVGSENPDPTTK
jgi:hypothetical protein